MMRSNQHPLSHTTALALLLAVAANLACAADYPTKPIRFIVPFPAGSVSDIQSRVVAQKVAAKLNQQVVVDNRAGAEGRIGVELIAKASADGYTVGLGTIGTLVISPLVYTKINYDPTTAFAPIAQLTSAPYLVVVHPTVPAATLKEFVDHAKSKPGQLNFGGGNVFVKLVLEMFNGAAGTKILYVPYQGSSYSLIDLVAGRVQLVIEAPAAFRQEIQAGKLRALAVTDTKRYAQLPNVPTTAEAGMPGFEVKAWFGLIAPRSTPANIVRQWNGEVNHALAQKDVREGFANQGFEPASGTPEQFAAHIRDERIKWSRVVTASGLKFD
jgi:tripartite-type tricarboxylate transporter receptor subunit TctC